MRNYVPCWNKIGISKDRYLELLHFCRQYPGWLADAQSYLGIQGHGMDGQPHGSGIGDPVYAAAEKRAAILARISLVETCARSVGHGEWFAALIENVCRGYPHARIPAKIMPSSKKSAFYQARKEFFLLLNERKDMTANETNRDT